MKVLDQLTNKKGLLKSADFAAQLAQQRDEVAARQAEITALRTRAGEVETEMQRLVVARELDGQDVDSALAKVRDARRAALERASDLDERTATGLVIIGELQRRHHQALVDENTAARQKLAEEYDGHAARIRALLLEAAALQEKAQRARHEEGELSCAPCVQRAGGLAAETFIEYRPLGPPLANLAEGYAAVDSGNRDLARLMKMS